MFSILNKPWLHFLIVGLCLYLGEQWWQSPSLKIVIPPSEEKVAELRGQWLRSSGRPPSDVELQQLIDNEIVQEILFQEALDKKWHITDSVVRQRLIRDMRFLEPDSTDNDKQLFETALVMQLHENDLVVRRRLIQRMEMLAYATVPQAAPDAGILRLRLQEQLDRFIHPQQITFKHIFLSRDKHPQTPLAAKQLLKEIDLLEAELAVSTGDPFIHGLSFNRLNEKQVARYFGVDFASDIMQLGENEIAAHLWQGPISSSYGEHLVWVESFRPTKAKVFSEVEKQLLAEWRREQERQALKDMTAKLRKRYFIQKTAGPAPNE
jgi:hypothetical protein